MADLLHQPAARIPSTFSAPPTASSSSSAAAERKPLLSKPPASPPAQEGFFAGMLGARTGTGTGTGAQTGVGLGARADVAQFGLSLVKSFCNPAGDIAGFVARDDCE